MNQSIRALVLITFTLGLPCCGVSRQLQYTHATNTFQIRPDGAQVAEFPRIHTGPGETSTASYVVPGTSVANWDYYARTLPGHGWSYDSQSDPPSVDHGILQGTLKFKRGFEHLWVAMNQIDANRVQIMETFFVSQPGDFGSPTMQNGWDDMFRWLPPENPVRDSKWMF
ncbi:MAG TPA: hypothetical protein VGN88_06260 [Phycisphaerae bacterium]|jgi:hypothetical protein